MQAQDLEAPPATPPEALERLNEGNQRFAKGKSLAIRRDLDRVKAIAGRQAPFAAFLGCADSRVPVEFVFDQGNELIVAGGVYDLQTGIVTPVDVNL